jgi:hypothetical protein
MQLSTAVWSLILLALLGANLPFFNQRLFAVVPLHKFKTQSTSKKSLWLRLIELIVIYFLLSGVSYLFEASIGNVFSQGWEFYAITGCLFIVFAFPGFVYQYLQRQK